MAKLTQARQAPLIRVAASHREIESFAPILAYSLFFPPLDQVDWATREGIENFRLAWLGKTLAGGLSVQPMGQWFGRRSVATGAVRCVAVAPEYRSRGIAQSLMVRLLHELHDRGIPLSTLYPSTLAFYRKTGFERGGVRVQWNVPTSALRTAAAGRRERGESAEIRALKPADEKTARALYAERARRSNGLLDRNEWYWLRFFRPLSTKNYGNFGVFEDGRMSGFVACAVEHAGAGSGLPSGRLRVPDVFGLSSDAIRVALAFLASHRSVCQETILHAAPGDALWHHLPNQDYSVERMHHWMLRLVDAQKALAARGYAAGVRAEVHLAIEDDLCPWNRGRLVLAVEGGVCEVRPGGRGTVKLDVRGLASLYTGYLSPIEMEPTGLVAGPAADLAALGSIFAGPAPWMPDMF